MKNEQFPGPQPPAPHFKLLFKRWGKKGVGGENLSEDSNLQRDGTNNSHLFLCETTHPVLVALSGAESW